MSEQPQQQNQDIESVSVGTSGGVASSYGASSQAWPVPSLHEGSYVSHRPGLCVDKLLQPHARLHQSPRRSYLGRFSVSLWRVFALWLAPAKALVQDMRATVFIMLVIPVALSGIALVSAVPLSMTELCDFLPAMGFTMSGATGGAIRLHGFDLAPKGMGVFLAGIVGAMGTALFTLIIVMLDALQVSFTSPVQQRIAAIRTGSFNSLLIQIVPFQIAAISWQVLSAFLWGGALWLMGECSYAKAVQTIVFIQVGGGLPADVFVPINVSPRMLVTVLGGWHIGFSALMISHTSALIDRGIGHIWHERSLKHLACMWGAFQFLTVPLAGMAYMVISAAAVWVRQDQRDRFAFEKEFWRSFSWMTEGAATLFPLEYTQDKDIVITAMAAYVGQALWYVAISIGISIAHDILKRLRQNLKPQRSVTWSFLQLCITTLVYVPSLVTGFSLVLGGILAMVEGWDFEEGFLWCFTAQLGGGMTLSSGQPTSRAGRLFCLIVSFWSFSVSSFSVGCAERPAINALITWLWQSIESIMDGCHDEGQSSADEKSLDAVENSNGDADAEEPPCQT
mmetsp:Transcript_117104/g.303758  ORF Transcript_117104/g.303758 Transcript_117104/m.303758 type:complete len:565 (-) Transcript_117104:47-1741(-)